MMTEAIERKTGETGKGESSNKIIGLEELKVILAKHPDIGGVIAAKSRDKPELMKYLLDPKLLYSIIAKKEIVKTESLEKREKLGEECNIQKAERFFSDFTLEIIKGYNLGIEERSEAHSISKNFSPNSIYNELAKKNNCDPKEITKTLEKKYEIKTENRLGIGKIPILRERESTKKEEISINTFFSPWGKYRNLPETDININVVYWGKDGLGTILKINNELKEKGIKGSNNLLYGTYDGKEVSIFRYDMKEAGIIGLEKNILSDEMGHVYFDKVLGFESSRVSDKNDSKILFFSPRRKQDVSIFELGELCSMISQFRFGDNFIASINWIFYLGDIKQYAFGRSFIQNIILERMIFEYGHNTIFQNKDSLNKYLNLYLSKLRKLQRNIDEGNNREILLDEKEAIVSAAEKMFFEKLVPAAQKAKREHQKKKKTIKIKDGDL